MATSSYTAFLSSTNLKTTDSTNISSIASTPRFPNNNLSFKPSFSLKPRCQLSNNQSYSLQALESLKSSPPDRYTKKSSSIIVIGLSHHSAPIEIREKLSIPEAQWPSAITELCLNPHIEEAAVLSTCNRMEIYVVALSKHMGVKEVTEWMSKVSSVEVSELWKHRFMLYDEDATRHLFEVSSGLDSLVLGEGQILAQVKQVVNTGQGVPGFGRKIGDLFKKALTAGKRVRTQTNIATGSVSVSSAAVELAFKKLPKCSHDKARMLVVGAGKMGKLVIKHLVAKGCNKIVVVNRTEERVDSIRKELKNVEIVYKPASESEMLTCASEADVVFTCTASDTILFSKDQVGNLQPASSHVGGQRLFVDISVPRNVGPCVSDLDCVHVYNVDDLKEVVANNQEDRLQKAMEAQAIITEEVKEFEENISSLETVPTIRKLNAYLERIRASEVEKSLSKMGDDIPNRIKEEFISFSKRLVKEVKRGPLENLRCNESDNRSLPTVLENMHAVNRIYRLDTEVPELELKPRPKK